ncbi:hypothetical protein [Halovivax cerinus]|uniref:Uncharacterized protein n=1 Tax=Halovivax cerinus TaxID=1487865 RepID=A0ABD5NMS8_9EURY|nr:hypothetical protein [Halovivax cerinus]
MTDNNQAKHTVAVGCDGSVQGHSQDGYPDDPSKRTVEENVYVAQARRFARYHVFHERGHPTVEPWALPESAVITAVAVASLSAREFAVAFGDYYHQYRSTVTDEVRPVIDHPDADGLLAYRQHVVLDVDLPTVLAETETSALAEALPVKSTTSPTAIAHAIGDHFDEVTDVSVDADTLSIDETSGLGVVYQTVDDVVEEGPADDVSGPPDARLELATIDPPWEDYLPVEGFQVLLVHHLLCQARDRFLEMGVEPPESLRLLGLGTFQQTIRNEHRPPYEPVHYSDADIDGYAFPDLGLEVQL